MILKNRDEPSQLTPPRPSSDKPVPIARWEGQEPLEPASPVELPDASTGMNVPRKTSR